MSEKKGKQWVDFRELKATITFEQVLERLDLLTGLTRVGDELQGPCPICQGDKEKSRSFNVNVAKQIFQCFACKRRGNMLDFTAAIRPTDAHGEALWLRDEFLHSNNSHPRETEHQHRDEAEGKSRPHPESTSQPSTSTEEAAGDHTLTEREQWLLEIFAHATAFALAQRFKGLTDVESLQRHIGNMVEVHSGREVGIS
jgi:hypothetical protein